MTFERKYLTQREWIDYCTHKTFRMKEVVEKIWFWIKKNDSWAKFHKKFKDFEKEYFVIVSIVRQARDLQKLTDEVMNHIAKRWKFNSRIFKRLELHTLRTIRKCARADYIMKSTLQRLKLAVMYRLRNSERGISRAILSNVIDWARMIDDLFDSERVTVEELRQLNLLHKESFFSRQEHEFAFSSLTSHAIKIIIIALINALIKKTLSTLDLISKKSDITDDIIDDITSDPGTTGGSDTIDGPDIIDDITGGITDDTTEGPDITSGTQSITNGITDDTTEGPDTTSDTQGITGGTISGTQGTTSGTQDITTDAALKRRRREDVEESCDCRESDVAWKSDLERHDNQIHDEKEALLLLSSMMYANWDICEIHHELLRIAFSLDDHEQRRMISLRLICIWKDRWNMTDIRTRHRLWFE